MIGLIGMYFSQCDSIFFQGSNPPQCMPSFGHSHYFQKMFTILSRGRNCYLQEYRLFLYKYILELQKKAF